MIDIISSKDMQINNIGSNLATLVYKNYDQIYQGRIEEDKRNGFGRLWTKEYQYIGSWKNDLPDGEGEYKYSGNTENISEKQIIYYKGEWKNGKRHGYGMEKYNNGEFFVGNLKNNMKHGNGKYYNKNGTLQFDVEWVENKTIKNSRITIYYENGCIKYTGEYSNDQWNGKGEEYYESGKIKFKGMFLDGKKHGSGIEYFENENVKYEGTFSHGLYDGNNCKLYHPNGKIFCEGDFYQNKLIKTNGIFDEKCNQVYLGELYDFKENDMLEDFTYNLYVMHGEGTLMKRNDDGEIYEYHGTFLNNKLTGDDCKIIREGILIYHGSCKKSLRHGNGVSYHFSNQNEKEYEGMFLNDYFKKGKIYYKFNKIMYEGEVQDNKFTGEGKLYKNNENSTLEYEGNFVSGKFSGQGTKFFPNGFIEYQGNWDYGKRNGDGSSHYESTGNIEYVGKWVHDEKHGDGILFDDSGSQIYSGSFHYNSIADLVN